MTRRSFSAVRVSGLLVFVTSLVTGATPVQAQAITQRGFVEGRGILFFQDGETDTKKQIADGLFREEVFVNPTRWLQFFGGFDARFNSYDQADNKWELDLEDRGLLRPRLALRRLGVSLTGGGVTLDLGKQFIRWGRADIIYPTDRFSPRDYLNVLDSEILPVIAARAAIQIKSETLEAVWTPQLTPSRIPLVNQRWTVFPHEIDPRDILDRGSDIPNDSQQYGLRWRHTGDRLETAISLFQGPNHLPNLDIRASAIGAPIELTRLYPEIRMYGGDIAVPTGWFTFKGEAAYVTSPESETEEYVLYVVEIERQTGDWLLDVGYAGDVVTKELPVISFSPDRGMARSIIGRATYTFDPRRNLTMEGAARQEGEGFYGKLEYSQALGEQWRLTYTAVGLAGDDDDFLGHYQQNSHFAVTLRASW